MKINDVQVRDAKRRQKFSTNNNDIRRGKPLDPAKCAGALAIKRDLGVKDARVCRDRTYILRKDDTGKYWERYKTPQALNTDQICLDRGGSIYPTTYVLVPLSPGIRFGGAKAAKQKAAAKKPATKPDDAEIDDVVKDKNKILDQDAKSKTDTPKETKSKAETPINPDLEDTDYETENEDETETEDEDEDDTEADEPEDKKPHGSKPEQKPLSMQARRRDPRHYHQAKGVRPRIFWNRS